MTARAARMLAALEDGCALIPLSAKGGEVVDHALIDEDNLEDLSYLRWYRTHWGYAAATFTLPRGPKNVCVFMHRAILDLYKGDKEQGDHINGDRLDNRRCNLRVVTHAQNLQNRSASRTSTSQHRGVSWAKNQGCWRAQARYDGFYFNESFHDEDEAARAVSAWRAEHMPFANEARA